MSAVWLGQQRSPGQQQAEGSGSSLCRARCFYDLSLAFFDAQN